MWSDCVDTTITTTLTPDTAITTTTTTSPALVFARAGAVALKRLRAMDYGTR
jgi:hypothetical protein